MSGNERGTDRAAALREYLLRHPDEYDFSFGDAEVDLVFSKLDDIDITRNEDEEKRYLPKRRAVELKLPADFVNSLQPDPQTGRCHLDDQRRNCPYSLQVAVLGSLGDVLRALPEVTGKGWRNPRERAQAEGMIRRGIAVLKASGVDVSFGVSPDDFRFEDRCEWGRDIPAGQDMARIKAMQENMAQICREASYYLKSDYHLPTAKCETPLEAMLQCIPGIGKEKSKALIDAGLRLRKDPPDFDVTAISGFGKKAAENIDRALM